MDEEIRKILEDYEKRISKLEDLIQTKPLVSEKKTSLKEFILLKNPKSDVEKTLVIGYYLEKYNGFSSFNTKDLEDAFRTAKEKVPENTNYKVINNIKKGHIMEAKEKKDNLKAWSITSTGERFVESNLEEKE